LLSYALLLASLQILDYARANGASAEIIEWGEIILTTAVLAIVITAPLGAVGISITGSSCVHMLCECDLFNGWILPCDTGPRWLEQEKVEDGAPSAEQSAAAVAIQRNFRAKTAEGDPSEQALAVASQV
jgi:hypothetical protein